MCTCWNCISTFAYLRHSSRLFFLNKNSCIERLTLSIHVYMSWLISYHNMLDKYPTINTSGTWRSCNKCMDKNVVHFFFFDRSCFNCSDFWRVASSSGFTTTLWLFLLIRVPHREFVTHWILEAPMLCPIYLFNKWHLFLESSTDISKKNTEFNIISLMKIHTWNKLLKCIHENIG